MVLTDVELMEPLQKEECTRSSKNDMTGTAARKRGPKEQNEDTESQTPVNGSLTQDRRNDDTYLENPGNRACPPSAKGTLRQVQQFCSESMGLMRIWVVIFSLVGAWLALWLEKEIRHEEQRMRDKKKQEQNPEPYPFPNRNQQSDKNLTHNLPLPTLMDWYPQSALTRPPARVNVAEQNIDTCPIPSQVDSPHQWIDDLPASNIQTNHASTRFFRSFRPSTYRSFQSTANQGGNNPNRLMGQSTRGECRKRAKNRQPQGTQRNGPPKPLPESIYEVDVIILRFTFLMYYELRRYRYHR
ncbi:hypothetical protein DFH08DRAFT_813705 [Mycena albidolilacea]|uniref:Uncharacterized protein n=1 Tax=Mycena albidolilacea TaxID=1033008 RepID=A0AAD6ZQK2_9AGAR|nr:hypothetical protein DFH08DRAFT_813705 [Mycena albidolilacea]